MVPATPTVIQDLMEAQEERELWIIGREFERPPWFHAGKGGDTRLARALRVCVEGRITPNSDGSYMVEGSEGRTYRVDKDCSCPQSQKGPSRYCYHLCAVTLYIEWQRRLRGLVPPLASQVLASNPDDDALGHGFPVDDQTLPLPLPPTSVDARLAQAAAVARDTVYHAAPLNQLADAPQIPQEDLMPHDAYIPEPEPDAAPVGVLDAPASAPRPLPTPVVLPSLDARILELSMQAWSAQRQVVKRFLQQELVEGTDYYTLRIKGRETKPALSKAGAEKFMALFQLHAVFEQDTATWTMLGSPQGTLCYRCQLYTRSGEMVGEGRGARTLQQDGGDINKAVKMGQKSAHVDAILRTGALSDVFTQDLDEQAAPAAAARPTSADLRSQIWAIVKARTSGLHDRAQIEAWIKLETGYDLHPDHYQAILARLQEVRF